MKVVLRDEFINILSEKKTLSTPAVLPTLDFVPFKMVSEMCVSNLNSISVEFIQPSLCIFNQNVIE